MRLPGKEIKQTIPRYGEDFGVDGSLGGGGVGSILENRNFAEYFAAAEKSDNKFLSGSSLFDDLNLTFSDDKKETGGSFSKKMNSPVR